MIFKRKKNDDLSSTSNGGLGIERITTKIEVLYVAVMCFVAACLSFMTLEVGARSPLGHSVTKSATFNAIFRRSYNLKIKIMITNVVMGLITTIMLALGDIYGIPYLYVPWLANTMKGMIFYEGPALLGLTYVWLPDTGISAGTFITLTFLLFVEEICLWFDVLSSFKRCWLEYNEQRMKTLVEPDKTTRLINPFNDFGNQIIGRAVTKTRLRDETAGPTMKPTITGTGVKSTTSDMIIKFKSTRNLKDSKQRSSRSKITKITV